MDCFVIPRKNQELTTLPTWKNKIRFVAPTGSFIQPLHLRTEKNMWSHSFLNLSWEDDSIDIFGHYSRISHDGLSGMGS